MVTPSFAPTGERLDLFKPDVLRTQLESGHLDHQLFQLWGSKYPHWDVLCSFALHPEQRAEWLPCLKLLIAKGAWLDHNDMNVPVGLLCIEDWGTVTPELTRELVLLYVDAGLVEVDQPLAGSLPSSKDNRYFNTGRMPLAAAIAYDHPEALELFLSMGASLELGPVHAGGPPRQALEWAQDIGSPRCTAILVQRAMRAELSQAATSATAPAAAAAPARQRRMGV